MSHPSLTGRALPRHCTNLIIICPATDVLVWSYAYVLIRFIIVAEGRNTSIGPYKAKVKKGKKERAAAKKSAQVTPPPQKKIPAKKPKSSTTDAKPSEVTPPPGKKTAKKPKSSTKEVLLNDGHTSWSLTFV